jgi:hypothetical protein
MHYNVANDRKIFFNNSGFLTRCGSTLDLGSGLSSGLALFDLALALDLGLTFGLAFDLTLDLDFLILVILVFAMKPLVVK